MSRIKANSDFYKGQMVTAGRYGPPFTVMGFEGDWVICWDVKAARECRYRASQLMGALE